MSDAQQRVRWPRVALVLGASALLGGATSYLQGWLPDYASSFANSASGWTLLTALLVFWSGARAVPSAVLGAVSFVLLVVGYTVAAELRGFTYRPAEWIAIGIVAGPFVGAAASWLRERGVRAALGTALLAGIGIGEGIYGLTVVADTTEPAYWIAAIVVAAALLLGMLTARLRAPRTALAAAGGTAVVSVAFWIAYRGVGSVGL